jgi:toxin ParE1/3/4
VSRRRVILRPQVAGDLLEIHDYLNERSAEAAERFLLRAESTLGDLADAPGLGSLKNFGGKLKGVRSRAVEGFPNHLIYYKPTRTSVVVLGVLHGARNLPSVLRQRRP